MGERSPGVRVAGVAAIAVAIALTLPAAAGAGVPTKSYACYGEAGTYISTLKIKSATKYNYLGKGGKYSYRAASKALKFKSGPLKPWVGGLFKSSDGDPAIKLVTEKAGGQTVDCYA